MKTEGIIVLGLTMYLCYGAALSCKKPSTSSARFSVNSHRNQSGHWIAKIHLEHPEVSKDSKETGLWDLSLDQSVKECGDYEAVSIEITFKGPSSGHNAPRVPGYEFYPGLGYYKIHKTQVPWDEAKEICQQEGGHLVIINSEAEAEALRKYITKHSIAGWIHAGFHDKTNEGEFITVLEEPLSSTGYVVWEKNEPNSLGGDEDCGSISPAVKLNDIVCSSKLQFICEYELYNIDYFVQ